MKLKLADIEIDNYVLQIGYEYDLFSHSDALFIMLFNNDGVLVAGSWCKTLEMYLPSTWAGLPNKEILIDEIIKRVKRIEKLKAFI
jgi:hypothetical protein